MLKQSLCITICMVGCLLSTSTSMSAVLLTPSYAVAETTTGGEEQATAVATIISGDEEQAAAVTTILSGDEEQATAVTTITSGDEEQATAVTTIISGDEDSPDIDSTNCTFKELLPEDVVPIGTRGKLLVKSSNLTLSLSQPYVYDPDKNVCYKRGELVNEQIFAACDKWEYDDSEFSVQEDGTVLLDEKVLEPGSYSIQNGRLGTCLPDEDDEDSNFTSDFPGQNSNLDKVNIIVGQADIH